MDRAHALVTQKTNLWVFGYCMLRNGKHSLENIKFLT